MWPCGSVTVKVTCPSIGTAPTFCVSDCAFSVEGIEVNPYTPKIPTKSTIALNSPTVVYRCIIHMYCKIILNVMENITCKNDQFGKTLLCRYTNTFVQFKRIALLSGSCRSRGGRSYGRLCGSIIGNIRECWFDSAWRQISTGKNYQHCNGYCNPDSNPCN